MTRSSALAKRLRPHRFCPACGAAMVPVAGSSRAELPSCQRCRAPLASGPTPAVGVAVLEEGRIVLVRRRYEPMAGAWGIPGGFVENDESPVDAARREVFEETGLRVRLAGLLGAYPGGFPQDRILFVCYRGVVEGGCLRAGDDADSVDFFFPHRLPEPLAGGPHRRVLQDLLAAGGFLAPGGVNSARPRP